MGLLPAGIEEVKVGEKVKSFNERTGQTSYTPVLELIQHEGTFQLVTVTLDSGETIEAAAGHPFYVQGKGWNVAANLKVGEALQLSNGTTLVVKTVDTSTRFAKVYNFAVAQNANYFVGMDGVLVHNSPHCPSFTADEQALVGLAGEAERKGLTLEDGDTLVEWARELGWDESYARGPEVHPTRNHGKYPHYHIHPFDHILLRW